MCIPVSTHTSGGFIIGDFESGTLFWQFVLSGMHHLGACCDPTGPAISTLGPTILSGRGRCDDSPAVHATATSTRQTRLITINGRARQRQRARKWQNHHARRSQAQAGPSVVRQRITHRNHPRVFYQACTRQNHGIGNRGAATKGAKGKGRSYFRDSKSVGERIPVPRVALFGGERIEVRRTFAG